MVTIIGLHDSCFKSQLSFSLGGENCGEAPQHIQWERGFWKSTTVFTDMHLKRAITHEGTAIALLIEPPSLSHTHYTMAYELRDHFDVILSPWAGGSDWYGTPFIHYPLGGSWIPLDQWGLWDKDKRWKTSIIISEKAGAIGHRLRHEVVKRLGEKLHVWGRGTFPMESKTQALGPYKYSIVIEPINLLGYFSEKLIDCLSVGTIPLYWGAPDIEDYFPGLPTWHTMDELGALLASPPEVDQETQLMWLNEARKYRCAEDWIATNIEGVFDD